MIVPRFVQSPLLLSLPGIYHAFLGVDPVAGRGDAERLRAVFCLPPSRIGTLRQIHSATVLAWKEGDASAGSGAGREGDGLWTGTPGTGVGVSTADCVPVLIADPARPVCAAVHAGWRGLAAGILGEAVRRIEEGCGSGTADRLRAAAGPSARGCCYEIGEEAADFLRPLPGAERHLLRGRAAGRWMADLAGLALEELAAAGVPRKNLEAVGPCSICSPSFHSYRREKSLTGRQLSFIYILDIQDSFPIENSPKRRETA